MNERPLLSIIIPVYNVSNYLEECVKSILNQKKVFAYEIILVDDGSTDGSGSLCDSYEGAGVKVLHQTNKGLSAARNVGFRHAKGEYVWFLDSDDWLVEDAFDQLAEYMNKENEVIFFESRKSINAMLNRTPLVLKQILKEQVAKEGLLKTMIRLNYPLGCAWNRIIRHE